MSRKITLSNIKQFIEGNTQMLLAEAGMQAPHLKEQVAYRMLICQSCMEVGKCEVCNCSVPGKLYVKESCNKGERFPDLMGKTEWEKYKIDNDIK
jgi:hypothetical protein